MSSIKEMQVDKLRVKIYETRQAMGEGAAKEAASKIKELISQKGEVNVIFAAAPSQNEFLASLIEDKGIDWSKINAFHMDEYVGISKDAPQAFSNFLKDRIFSKVSFKSVNYIDVSAKDAEKECERYSNLLKQYPADLVCMGIGENGHIAFNDPPVADFNDKKVVKVVELEQKCRQQQVNDGCFKTIDDVPKYALTLTIPTLMACKYVFCMVPGKTKTEAVTRTVNDEISTACPATILRTHDNAVLYVDKDSGSEL
ncbi:MAG TPA: glucosamine-6-phosphate deaminase [Clostridiales bacterium]|nr:glucosamine-6-phosphate deaminase [Clostridiales bacterium]